MVLGRGYMGGVKVDLVRFFNCLCTRAWCSTEDDVLHCAVFVIRLSSLGFVRMKEKKMEMCGRNTMVFSRKYDKGVFTHRCTIHKPVARKSTPID